MYMVLPHRPLSRRLDRFDRMIQNESNDGNVCLFSAATHTSQCKLRSLRAENKHTLTPFGSIASLSIAMSSNTSRRQTCIMLKT